MIEEKSFLRQEIRTLYIDLNPKRAAKVKHPRQNRYSSYRYYAYGEADPLITPAPSYLALAATPRERQQSYQELVQEILRDDWKEKKPYSSVYFIGNPDWVLTKTKQLHQIGRMRHEAWKQRYRERFG